MGSNGVVGQLCEKLWGRNRRAKTAELRVRFAVAVGRGHREAPSPPTSRAVMASVTDGRRVLRAFILALLGFCVAAQVGAAELGIIAGDGQTIRKLLVTVNKSRTIQTNRPFLRTVVAAPEMADVLPINNRTLYIQGKKIGNTNLSIFDDNGRIIEVIDLEVQVDSANIQDKIAQMGGGRGIRVVARGGQVMLTGMAADSVVADRALTVAKGLAPEAVVVNSMEVAPPQQVMLEVRFLEVARTAGRELGVNMFGLTPGVRGFSTGLQPLASSPVNNIPPGSPPAANVTCTTGQCQTSQPPGTSPVSVFSTVGTLLGATTTGPFGTILANIFNNGRGTSLDVMVTALEQQGLVRRLAEPNLIALSGDTARFLAGGEFPVPVPSTSTSGVPTIAIQYKKFGVELAFVPTVLSRGVINLRVEPSVSELDFVNTVTISGTQVPSLTVRDARTTVELRDGQSFAIAGLLQTRNEKQLAQLPWIGSVPVIGSLFRSSAFQQQQTDLVIIVTPRLVEPAVPGQRLASPLDDRLPGNDVDFFLNGQPDVRKRYSDFVTSGGNLKGPYGHIIAPEFGVGGVVTKSETVVSAN
jgi:pilus assembly protein CpaC